MFFEENEPCEENETNKYYPNDQSYIDNNLIFYEKSENFQDSFLQTFNNQFYNQNYLMVLLKNCKTEHPKKKVDIKLDFINFD